MNNIVGLSDTAARGLTPEQVTGHVCVLVLAVVFVFLVKLQEFLHIIQQVA